MEIIGKMLLFGGLIIVIVSHLYIVMLAFRRKIIQGLLALIIPGYVIIFAIREESQHFNALVILSLGLIASITGGIILLP